LKISNAELGIMQVIWEEGKEMTYSQISRAMVHNRKQVTQTLITRLVNKGILKQEKRDVYYYTPVVSKEEYRYAKAKDLINRAYSGSTKDLVATLLRQKDFSPDDFEELKQYWFKGGSRNE